MQNWTTKKVLLKTQSKKPNNFLYYQIYFDSFYFGFKPVFLAEKNKKTTS